MREGYTCRVAGPHRDAVTWNAYGNEVTRGDELGDAIWPRLQVVLSEFARRSLAADPTLRHQVARTRNEAFPLRAYLALSRRTDGDEVAIIVDIKNNGERVAVTSDACTDGGRVLADGPCATVALSASHLDVEAALSSWLADFERFLLRSESLIRRETARLT